VETSALWPAPRPDASSPIVSGITAALVLLVSGNSAASAGQGSEPPAFVEVVAARAEYFEREPVRVTVRFGLDRELLRGGILPLSTRELDLPVQVAAPWLEGSTGGPRRARPLDGDLGVALGDGVGVARRAENVEREGRTLAVFEVERTLAAADAGELVLEAPALRFTWSARTGEATLGGGAPEDWRPALVRGEPLALRILPLPESGRPPEFSGAVGRFTVRASAEPHDVRVGESVRLTLVVEGEGDLASFAAPRLDRLRGFHLLGQSETRGERERSVVYDLAPESDAVTEIPAVAFSYFDTGELRGYRTAYTQPIALAVRPRAGSAHEPARAVERDPPGSEPAETPGSTRVALVGAALALIAALALARRRARA
jgi:hypothetical protein